MKRIIVAGSRTITGEAAHLLVRAGLSLYGVSYNTDIIIAGGAKGVDAAARDVAASLSIMYEEYPADWDRYGKSAGPIRNAEMASVADALVLIWDGQSRGSAHMRRTARERGLEIVEIVVADRHPRQFTMAGEKEE